jgi:putative tryptophan/tyrosine transport system substrate-binding protein
MRRREFIKLVAGAAAAWPTVARGQQASMPLVGFIDRRSAILADDYGAFVHGLSELGFVDHHNVLIDRRQVDDVDQFAAAAADLVRNKVAVICGPVNAIIAARTAAGAIPMVFIGSSDPVAAGLVSSFSRPGGNITGVRLSAGDLPSKQPELLHELMPAATKVGLLINPQFTNSEPDAASAVAAARIVGITLLVKHVIAESEFEAVFTSFAQEGVSAILVISNLFFSSYRDRLAALALRQGLPLFSTSRIYPDAGGLASYGANTFDVICQAGTYVGRILKGERPADLPVMQPTKFELVINLKTAKALGLEIPPQLLARADEVIE